MPELHRFFSPDDWILVEGTIAAMVSQDPWQLLLEGGGLAEFGWVAFERTIHLKPLPSTTKPVLYLFSFNFNTGYVLASKGLQISLAAATANIAAAIYDPPLPLVNNVHSEEEKLTLNLGIVVEVTATGEFHNFDDPTILFDPPQT